MMCCKSLYFLTKSGKSLIDLNYPFNEGAIMNIIKGGECF